MALEQGKEALFIVAIANRVIDLEVGDDEDGGGILAHGSVFPFG
jgi:hypothetical protein